MQAAQIAPEAANQLIDGYCDDFISLAAVLAQTLEQVSMRGIDIAESSEKLRRISVGMSSLSQAIAAVLPSGKQGAVSDKDEAPAARGPRRPDRAHAKQAALKGNNRSMPLRSVFQFIERMSKSGIVNVKLDDETLRFKFKEGHLVASATNNQGKGDRLGDLLADICDPAAIATVLRSSDTTDNSAVGEQVLRAGAASREEVTQALTMQMHARFARACDAPDATYAFMEAPPQKADAEPDLDRE